MKAAEWIKERPADGSLGGVGYMPYAIITTEGISLVKYDTPQFTLSLYEAEKLRDWLIEVL